MANQFIYAAGNFLDPVVKGVHLHTFKDLNHSYYEKTKAQLEVLVDKLCPSPTEDVALPLSPGGGLGDDSVELLLLLLLLLLLRYPQQVSKNIGE